MSHLMNRLAHLMIMTVLFLYSSYALSVEADSLKYRHIELQINDYMGNLYNPDTELNRQQYNDSIIRLFNDVFDDTSSFYYPFDSLRQIGVFDSPDGLFRIYNWAFPESGNNYHYHAFIQYYDENNGDYSIYRLTDSSAHIREPENAVCSADRWFGALYYDIIPTEFRGIKLYTLLGFDYNNISSRKKIIEVLKFNEDNTLQFGYPVFRAGKKLARRIVFEYSAKAVMTLRYDTNAEMIVYDHLSPPRPSMEGHYEFYGPDFSYDAFYFENGYWNYKPDIDIRNPKEED